MVLGWQGVGYLGSPQTLGSEDCGQQGPWLEGNYLLGCLLAWNLAIWLPYSKYHGSWLPKGLVSQDCIR